MGVLFPHHESPRKVVLHPADWDILEAGEMAATERRLERRAGDGRSEKIAELAARNGSLVYFTFKKKYWFLATNMRC